MNDLRVGIYKINNFKRLTFILCVLILAACAESQPAKSPSDVLKNYIDGYNSRNIAAMKETFSEDTRKMYEQIARKNNSSLDEIIKGQFEAAPANMQKLEIEPGEEKIEGDEATVEAKNKTLNKSDKMPFVKENGQWKLALDKFIKNTLEKDRIEYAK